MFAVRDLNLSLLSKHAVSSLGWVERQYYYFFYPDLIRAAHISFPGSSTDAEYWSEYELVMLPSDMWANLLRDASMYTGSELDTVCGEHTV